VTSISPARALSPIAAAPADPLAYVAAVNNMVQQGAPALAGSQPGWLHLWDASSGNLLRQWSNRRRLGRVRLGPWFAEPFAYTHRRFFHVLARLGRRR